VNRNKTGTEQERNRNGTGTEQERNRNGTNWSFPLQKPWINNLMNVKKKHYLIYLLPQLGFGAHNYLYLFGTIFGFNSSCQINVFFLNENRN
jgi:hypothetical protein